MLSGIERSAPRVRVRVARSVLEGGELAHHELGAGGGGGAEHDSAVGGVAGEQEDRPAVCRSLVGECDSRDSRKAVRLCDVRRETVIYLLSFAAFVPDLLIGVCLFRNS